MNLQDLLDAYQSSPSLKLKDGACTLRLNDTYDVVIESALDERHFYLYSIIGAIQSDDVQQLRDLLAGNLFGKATGPCNLALDESSDKVVLFRRMSLEEADAYQLRAALSQFISVLTLWTERLKKEPSVGSQMLDKRLTGFLEDEQLQVFFV